MWKRFKKNFDFQSLLERLICCMMCTIAAFWLFHGQVSVAIFLMVAAMVDPKWFDK